MMIDRQNIREYLTALNFKAKNNDNDTYTHQHGVTIHLKDIFHKSTIKYDDKIQICRDVICNFTKQENFVVLECVLRLLDKGYKKENIILEKNYPVGHANSGGYLDIQVNKNKKCYLMIECKTFDKEYVKAISKTKQDGDQLFGYYMQDKNAQYLCMYSSHFKNNKIEYSNAIIKITESMKNTANKSEVYENWRPQILERGGIFEECATPYNIKQPILLKKDLKKLQEHDGGIIFNSFAEILRRNVVSDKSNAYNKIFNLFLCKIVDESERADDTELEFQWKNESNEDVILRLSQLYKRGMKNYLDLKISSIDMDDVSKKLKSVRSSKINEEILNMFKEQKLYTSNDFAFKEVFDKNTFELNCIVVKEVVKLLEGYKIRYDAKYQFLGDFFEKLLNTGIKQEAGQFFTPLPIAEFVTRSLPISEIIENKIKNDELHILPYCIDYASGAGHFLTSLMDEINKEISQIKLKDIKNTKTQKNFNGYKKDFDWAKEFIYGIEKDYRLAKTTKISTFLNGDGDAKILCADGLDSFDSKHYKGKLYSDEGSKLLSKFDIVASNPPYAVDGFKSTISNSNHSFDLYDQITDKSKEIECMFVERTKQLLCINGVAGIILPISILEKDKNHAKAREMLLEDFEIKGISEFGPGTFMATNINTIVVFLRRIKNIKEQVMNGICENISESMDSKINDVETPISKFLAYTYKIPLSDYFNLLKKIPTDRVIKSEIYESYEYHFQNNKHHKNLIKSTQFKKLADDEQLKNKNDLLLDYIVETEITKICNFILSYGKKIIISHFPSGRNTKKHVLKILGYKFNTRRGHEGIQIIKKGGIMYNPNDLCDKNKISTYILDNFLGKDNLAIHSDADESITIRYQNSLFDYLEGKFDKSIQLKQSAAIKFKDSIPIDRLSNRIDVQIGGTPDTLKPEYYTGDNLFIGIGDMDGNIIDDAQKKISTEGIKNSNCKIVPKDTTLLSFKLSVGKTAIAGKDLYTNEAIAAFIIKEEYRDKILNKYLFYFFSSRCAKILLYKNNNAFGQSFNSDHLKELKIPFLEISQQRKMVKTLSNFDTDISKLKNSIQDIQDKIQTIIKFEFQNQSKIKIRELVEESDLISGNRPKGGVDQYVDGVISIGGTHIGGDGRLNLEELDYVPEEYYDMHEELLIKSNDIIMCKDGAQTGKVALIDEDYALTSIINEHVFIIRSNVNINQKYLFHMLNNEKAKQKIKIEAKKIAQPGLDRESLFSIDIPYPKLDHQIEILEKIERMNKEKEFMINKIIEVTNKKDQIVNSYVIQVE